MTKQELLNALQLLNAERELKWMLDLGYQLTICARGAYPLDERPGSMQHLRGFNEMQHQVYGRIRHLGRGEEWTLDSFIDGLMERARTYEVEGDLNFAFTASLRGIRFNHLPSQIQ